MNTISHIRKRAMKSARTILIGSRYSSFLGFAPANYHHTLAAANNSLKPRFNLDYYPFQLLGFQRVLGGAQKAFHSPSSNSCLSRSFSLSKANRDISTTARVALKVRNFSTSIETRVNDNNFERIYIQGGINLKPLVVEGVDKGEENVVGVVKNKGEETEVEKQAWKLLEDAVVTYCGNPVGTMAANDPSDKQPLNYDQVFIRDFVPSALAFLLRGDHEIVKNFLLHTLQLQVTTYSFRVI